MPTTAIEYVFNLIVVSLKPLPRSQSAIIHTGAHVLLWVHYKHQVQHVKGTVSQYKRPEVTVFKTFSNQLQMVMNDDIVCPQARTRYVGHERLCIEGWDAHTTPKFLK